MKKTIVTLLVLVLAAVAIIWLMSRGNGETTQVREGNTEQEVQENVKRFTVNGANFSFAPNTMTVAKGDTVEITFVNEEGFHDLIIDELGVDTGQIAAGSEVTVSFVASQAGTFEYYCSVGTHREMGMVGTLTVTE